MTKWDLSQECKIRLIYENQLMPYTIATSPEDTTRGLKEMHFTKSF